MTLIDYITKHTDRNACRCGRCVDKDDDKPLDGHTANIVFFDVSAKGEPSKDELTELIKAHTGAFYDLDPFDGKKHSYIELGAWLGDQQTALLLIGLGAVIGLWKLLTPYTMLGKDVPEPLAQMMAGQGLVALQAMVE